MSLIIPILLAALCMGLFVRRMTPKLWAGLVGWIALVVVVHLFKS